MKDETKLKKWTLTRWKKEADKKFSEYIRKRDKGKCYTCNFRGEWKEIQCGHFNPRQHLKTRYDEQNNHGQCYVCNVLYGGQPATYAKNLIRDYGEGIIEELERGRHEVCKLEKTDYLNLIEKYERKIKEL